MVRDRRTDPEQPKRFVWESDDARSAPAPRVRRTVRHGRALVAVAVIVPLAGGAAGLVAYQGGHAPTVNAADAGQATLPLRTASTRPAVSPSPSAKPSPSPSADPAESPSKRLTPSAPKAPESVVTVVKTAPVVTHVVTATASAPKPIGDWPLNHSAADTAGSHDGSTYNVSWDGAAAVFAGSTDSYMGTSGPVLDTASGHSFTVSAWVYLTSDPTAPQYAATVVSQGAGVDSGFYLQYLLVCNCWAFSRVATNTVNPTGIHAQAADTAKLDAWTHLVGVYDGSNGNMSLYVNGAWQSTVNDPTPFASSGDLMVGGAVYNSQASDAFHGLVGDVEVFDVALSTSEASGGF
ncbi:LamG domain-containing protein [Actinospica durhamensis]|uniref:LamG domain-containing protein n=1 Tax=Actinospica durhamensis TaxID=1508375 RepID=A0A941EI03_9ACTN|nr:LamG domain-containing protein [Actinospica durhamensis]MBR7831827.1 LamG domain-containing protein [Actinospica durhamensis]